MRATPFRNDRLACAELFEIMWRDGAGKSQKSIGSLDSVSIKGARLLAEHPIP